MSLPQPNGDFEWVQAPWGAALRCRPLASIAPHYFSTRQAAPEQTLADALGVGLDDLVRMKQVHRADVFVAHGRSLSKPDADIAVTDNRSVALSVKVADCVPVLLADRHTGAVAAIHAGWKGTAAGAVRVAVESLQSNYGTVTSDIVAAVGPSIGPCCYEVGPDLAKHFSSHPEAATWFTRDAKPHLDLWRATRDQLARARVPPHQIHVCELCTFDHPALFHSYRREGANAGRLVAAIRSAPDRTP
ncbi:MAG TPA: peptidoglycan editing factor PgeF [Vicinamibacterales bacterium]|nr:peptidoglycan editing factor PgeF [Vicinamibacterales bacterium]